MRPIVEILIAATVGALFAAGYVAERMLRDGHEIGMVGGSAAIWCGAIGAVFGGAAWGVFRVALGAFQ